MAEYLSKKQMAKKARGVCIEPGCESTEIYPVRRGGFSLRCKGCAVARRATRAAYRAGIACTNCARRPRQSGSEICAVCARGGGRVITNTKSLEVAMGDCLRKLERLGAPDTVRVAALDDYNQRLAAMQRLGVPPGNLVQLIQECFEEALRVWKKPQPASFVVALVTDPCE